MRVDNPIQMNDWGIKQFLSTVLIIQLSLWSVLGLEAAGLRLPVIRQFISYTYLLYVPGILILRVFRLHKLGNIKTLLYSVGLSITILMFTGLFMNAFYPFLGVPRPISIMPLSVTIGVIILVLCGISYLRDKNFSEPSYLDTGELFSPPALFLLLVSLLSVIGSYLVAAYESNFLLMVLMVLIALISILIGFGKFFPKRLYPLAIFVIALSLIFHRTLSSFYISGSDIHHEYYLANLVKINGIWDSTIPVSYNSMLSVVMLGPISSIMGDMSLTWVFKIIYPLLFALVPLGLFHIFRKQTDDKIAFFSCFFFVAVFQFYTEIPTIMRQQIATIFLILLIFLMIESEINNNSRVFFTIIFSASLVVSHYALAYVYMFLLIFAWVMLALIRTRRAQNLENYLYSKFGRQQLEKSSDALISGAENRVTSFAFVILFILFALAWYMYIAKSTVFNSVANLGSVVASTIFTEFLNPGSSHGLTLLLTKPRSGFLNQTHAIINYANQAFIILGITSLLLRRKELKFEREYAVFAVSGLAIVLVNLLVPSVSLTFSMDRLYFIVLVFLAPFSVIGAMISLGIVHRAVEALWENTHMTRWLKASSLGLLALYFAAFFLFQTGFIRQVTEGYSGSVVLSEEGILKYGNLSEKAMLYNATTPKWDVFSASWLSSNMEAQTRVYATFEDIRVHTLLSYSMVPIGNVSVLAKTTERIPQDAYVYLQSINIVEGIGTEFMAELIHGRELSFFSMEEISHLYRERNKIYSNGGSEIYR